MSDVQLRKKVQLKQKQEAPAVTLKTKKPGDAIVGTAATAVAATAAAAKAASNATTAGTASAPIVNAAGVEAKPAADSAKAATGATGAGIPSKSEYSKQAGTTATSSTGNDGKKGGKAWAWILGAAAVAGLAFGGYKLATNNSNNEKYSLSAGNKTAVVDGQGNTMTGENNVVNPSTRSSSDVNSESATGANGFENSGTNGVVPNNASAGADGSNSGNNIGAVGSGTSNDNSAAANTVAANGVQNPSNVSTGNAGTASTASSSNATKPVVILSVSDDQAVCLFSFDSSVVGESEVLDKLAAFAMSSGRKVVINAYADEIGAEDYNQVLSQRRANAVKNYFIKKGVDAVTITASGKGETTQYATRAENRRADISIQ